MSLVLRYAARSDRGLVRSNNEDSVYAGARLLALADGMGGHAAGEVASQLVIAALAHLDDDEPGGDLLGKLGTAVAEGNAAIAAYVEQHPEVDGMGTTLDAILFAGDRIGLAHVGDSRAYLLRDGELTQITKDDTFVQTLVDEGRITPEEAHSHPQRSLIMRALTGHEVEPTLTMRETQAGDRYLLCSDGLSDPVSTETILEALQIPDVNDAALRLIEMALRGGGPDNVTVVVADVVDVAYGQTQPILAGAVSDDEEHLTALNTAAGRASAIAPPKAVTKRVLPRMETEAGRPRSRRRTWIIAGVLLLMLAAAVVIGRIVVRTNYYVAEYHGKVAIMRGVQGSLLGVALQEPYLLGCLNDQGDLSLIPYSQAGDKLSCQPMTLQDLKQARREQVAGGLPSGSRDAAVAQLTNLAKEAVLPPCPPAAPATQRPVEPHGPRPGPAPTTTSSTPTTTSATPTTHPAPPSNTAPPPVPGTDCRAAA